MEVKWKNRKAICKVEGPSQVPNDLLVINREGGSKLLVARLKANAKGSA